MVTVKVCSLKKRILAILVGAAYSQSSFSEQAGCQGYYADGTTGVLVAC
ncbi:hypothetical protein ACSVDA_21750 [Cytobacillus sp. Hm23]